MYCLIEMCCICLKTRDNLKCLTWNDGNDVSYSEKLSVSFRDEFLNDIDESKICPVCCYKLDIVYDFHRQCVSSRSLLRSYLQQLKTVGEKRGDVEIVVERCETGPDGYKRVFVKEEIVDDDVSGAKRTRTDDDAQIRYEECQIEHLRQIRALLEEHHRIKPDPEINESVHPLKRIQNLIATLDEKFKPWDRIELGLLPECHGDNIFGLPWNIKIPHFEKILDWYEENATSYDIDESEAEMISMLYPEKKRGSDSSLRKLQDFTSGLLEKLQENSVGMQMEQVLDSMEDFGDDESNPLGDVRMLEEYGMNIERDEAMGHFLAYEGEVERFERLSQPEEVMIKTEENLDEFEPETGPYEAPSGMYLKQDEVDIKDESTDVFVEPAPVDYVPMPPPFPIPFLMKSPKPKIDYRNAKERKRYRKLAELSHMPSELRERYLKSLKLPNETKEAVLRFSKSLDVQKPDPPSGTESPADKINNMLSLALRCHICSVPCHNISNLTHHMTTIHNYLAHRCNVCALHFKHPRTLEDHIQSHTNGHQYHCTLCNKKYGQLGALTLHLKKHKKVFTCGSCNATLDASQRFERTNDCVACSKSRKKQKQPWKPTNKERNYQCGVCGKQCKNNPSLYEHMQVHKIDYKLCRCGICGKEFQYESLLAIHIKTHI